MTEEEDGPTPWWRYAIAFTLGGSILAMTYVLFDPDLGTSVPVFQEFTCRGELKLELRNGYWGPDLQVPESALRLNATGEGELRPVLVVIMTKEGDADWKEFHRAEAPSGSGAWFVAPTTNMTQVRLDVRDLEGKYCGASATIAPLSSA